MTGGSLHDSQLEGKLRRAGGQGAGSLNGAVGELWDGEVSSQRHKNLP